MEVWYAALAQSTKPELPLPLVLAVFAATTAMIVLTRRRAKRAAESPPHRIRAMNDTNTVRRQIEGDLHAVMLELEKLARQVNAQIETRYRKLEAVIRDADARIAELQRLGGAPQGEPTRPQGLDVTVGSGEAAETISAPAGGDFSGAVCRLADAGVSPQAIADRLGRAIGEVELVLALRRPREIGVS